MQRRVVRIFQSLRCNLAELLQVHTVNSIFGQKHRKGKQKADYYVYLLLLSTTQNFFVKIFSLKIMLA